MENPKIALFRFIQVMLFSSLVLAACGSEAQPSATATPVFSPTPYPTYTALATQAAYPTYTPPATQTAYPTYTPYPTFTPTPTPTPAPNPTKLFIGSNSEVWGEIIRYQPSFPGEKLEIVPLSDSLKATLAEWFKDPQKLDMLPEKLDSSLFNYILKLDPKFVQKIVTGLTTDSNFSVSLIGGFYGSNTKAAIPWVTNLANMSPLTMWQLVMGISSLIYLDSISQQLKILSEDINKIKDFLVQEKLSDVSGTLKYLRDMQKPVFDQTLQSSDVLAFTNELEQIEKDSYSLMDFAKAQMDKSELRFKEVNLDKQFVVFRNEEALTKLKIEIEEFKRYSYVYLVALGGRGLGAQIRCMLPVSKERAKYILNNSIQQLVDWKTAQTTFYTTVENRIKEMDGWLADDKKTNQFREIVKSGRLESDNKSMNLNTEFVTTIGKVDSYLKSITNGLDLVVELDGNGEIKQVYRVVKA